MTKALNDLSKETAGMNGKGQLYDPYAETLAELSSIFGVNYNFNKKAKMENEDELKQAEQDMKAILKKTEQLAQPESATDSSEEE